MSNSTRIAAAIAILAGAAACTATPSPPSTPSPTPSASQVREGVIEKARFFCEPDGSVLVSPRTGGAIQNGTDPKDGTGVRLFKDGDRILFEDGSAFDLDCKEAR
ncbi:hypothetical protein [Propionibacterium freudenreichii]|uniref:hypothetical protein n=1 Tax=Propionibacterium freudenreichii TaxID=1744 RepID=UPI000542DE47|nr:hypothetical protein [Propionibacterium freudenreichii]CEG94390.1 Protein of unknown function [Propionibacterium freudenreichii]